MRPPRRASSFLRPRSEWRFQAPRFLRGRRSGRRPGARFPMPELAAVVVTYNALPYLGRCLESLARYDTVVVDHGSTDGTLDLVRVRFPRASIVEQENRGLAAG